MEGRCESNRGGDEMYPATFGNEEETGLKLDDDDRGPAPRGAREAAPPPPPNRNAWPP